MLHTDKGQQRPIDHNRLVAATGCSIMPYEIENMDVIAKHGVLDEGVQFIQKPFTNWDPAAKVRKVLDD